MSYYTTHADELFERYESVDPSALYPLYLPEIMKRTGSHALDVGAGSGRDAAWLGRLGFRVTAAEPNDAMRAKARAIHGDGIEWHAASLPGLVGIDLPDQSCDLVLCNGVFMHVPPTERKAALLRLSSLLSERGVLCLGFRAVSDADLGREMYPIHVEEIEGLARQLGLDFRHETTEDILGRVAVTWWTCTISK